MIGYGYDIHRLVGGNRFILGGIEIASDRGTVAHSDGDVLLHALCDALLGAAALGDIGRHFPDTSEEFRDISSIVLLQRVQQMLSERGLRIENIDATVILERPKLAPYIDEIRRSIASTLGIVIDRCSVKAKTNEGLGAIGSGDAVAAHVVVQLAA